MSFARSSISCRQASLLDIAETDERVIVDNSLSKTWVMTGSRLGWHVRPVGTRDTVSDIVEVTRGPLHPARRRRRPRRYELCRALPRPLRGGSAAAWAKALGALNGVRYAPPDGAVYAFGVEGTRLAVAPGGAFGAAGNGHLGVCFAQEPERLTRAMARLRLGLAAS